MAIDFMDLPRLGVKGLPALAGEARRLEQLGKPSGQRTDFERAVEDLYQANIGLGTDPEKAAERREAALALQAKVGPEEVSAARALGAAIRTLMVQKVVQGQSPVTFAERVSPDAFMARLRALQSVTENAAKIGHPLTELQRNELREDLDILKNASTNVLSLLEQWAKGRLRPQEANCEALLGLDKGGPMKPKNASLPDMLRNYAPDMTIMFDRRELGDRPQVCGVSLREYLIKLGNMLERDDIGFAEVRLNAPPAADLGAFFEWMIGKLKHAGYKNEPIVELLTRARDLPAAIRGGSLSSLERELAGPSAKAAPAPALSQAVT